VGKSTIPLYQWRDCTNRKPRDRKPRDRKPRDHKRYTAKGDPRRQPARGAAGGKNCRHVPAIAAGAQAKRTVFFLGDHD